jgi:proline iminopeptidase
VDFQLCYSGGINWESVVKFLSILFSFSVLAIAQQTGLVKTPDVDLAYETYGAPNSATPVIVANGGPGLSHIYMMQNDVWPRLAKTRQIVFYDQRGTGKAIPMEAS